MKKFVLLVALVASVLSAQSTYTWNVASGSWATAANWTPSRSTPATDDILVFDGATQATPAVTGLPATQTFGKIIFQNNVVADFSASAASALTVGGGTGTDFDIQSGSELKLTGSFAVTINIATGATGAIAGTFRCPGTATAAHRLIPVDASSLIVSGSVIQGNATGSSFTGNIFGTSSVASVIFQSGSSYYQRQGSNPFAASAPNSRVVFQTGSTYYYYLGGTPSLSGRTFANLTFGNGQAPTATLNLSSDCTMDNLTLETGTSLVLYKSGAAPSTGVLRIKGNITQNSNVTGLKIANAAAGISLEGGGTITISGSGSAVCQFVGSVSIASGTTVVLARNIVDSTSLTVNGTFNTAGFTLSGNPNFTLASGGTLKTGATGGIDASITGSGSKSYSTSGNYEFNGSAAQITGASLPSTVNNFTVANAAGVTLSNALTVSGTATLTSGNLTLGSNNLTLSSTVAGSPDASKHIVTDGAGKVVKNIATSGSFLFPVGYDASTYNPVTVALDGGSTADDFSVKVSSGVTPAAENNAAAVAATWDIAEGVAGGSNATLTFQWTGAQEGGSFTRGTSAVWHHNGSVWANVSGGTASGSDPYTISTNSTVSSFSPYIVGNDGALPVEVASFSAATKGKNVELKWNTASESNNRGFEVERSVNGTWTKVGFVEGAGNSNVAKSYGYTDAVTAIGNYSYRLKQVDNNGSFRYVGTVEVTVAAAPEAYTLTQNYPNPFNPSTSMQFTVKKMGPASMKVYDITGREVANLFNEIAQPGQVYTVRFDASRLASGVYFYVLNSGDFHSVKKMQLLK